MPKRRAAAINAFPLNGCGERRYVGRTLGCDGSDDAVRCRDLGYAAPGSGLIPVSVGAVGPPPPPTPTGGKPRVRSVVVAAGTWATVACMGGEDLVFGRSRTRSTTAAASAT